jgi:lipoprotein NlpD
VIKGFKGSQSTQQGIDIAGQKGQKILAAAAGEVVYSGEGPALYGQMVIIQHSEAYLTAYGYNSKLLVKEGDKVGAKQPIATMGQKASQKPQLHFEIRKYGKPVNPASYLPKRS